MNQEQTIQDILEVVTYLKDNMVSRDEFEEKTKNFATKDDIREIREEMKNFATKDDLSEMKNEIINHIDSFIRLYQK